MVATIYHVIGTDTDVGKTIATAALAAVLRSLGQQVAIFKPAQTGVLAGEPGDVQLAGYLSGADAYEGARCTLPMAPVLAAEYDGVSLPSLAEYARQVLRLAAEYDAVIVEGAGGVSVDLGAIAPFGERYVSQNQADLIALIAEEAEGIPQRNLIVARAGLGTLNHVELTRQYLYQWGLGCAGVIIGSLPAKPSRVERDNLKFLERMGYLLVGAIPAGVGKGFTVGEHREFVHDDAEVRCFREQAGQWLGGLRLL